MISARHTSNRQSFKKVTCPFKASTLVLCHICRRIRMQSEQLPLSSRHWCLGRPGRVNNRSRWACLEETFVMLDEIIWFRTCVRKTQILTYRVSPINCCYVLNNLWCDSTKLMNCASKLLKLVCRVSRNPYRMSNTLYLTCKGSREVYFR